jgi:hypothetical protein
MKKYTLTLTYKNEAGEIDTLDIEANGIRQTVIEEGKRFLKSIGLNHEAIIKADIRCPAFISIGL